MIRGLDSGNWHSSRHTRLVVIEETDNLQSDRRVKLIRIDEANVLRLLSSDRSYRLASPDLPEDHVVVGVMAGEFMNPPALAFMVSHPSFPLVPENEHPPYIEGRWELIAHDTESPSESPESWRDRKPLL